MKKNKQSFSSNKLAELKSKDLAELNKDLAEVRKQLARFRLEVATGKIKNKRAGKAQRRNIAQILTIIKEKERK